MGKNRSHKKKIANMKSKSNAIVAIIIAADVERCERTVSRITHRRKLVSYVIDRHTYVFNGHFSILIMNILVTFQSTHPRCASFHYDPLFLFAATVCRFLLTVHHIHYTLFISISGSFLFSLAISIHRMPFFPLFSLFWKCKQQAANWSRTRKKHTDRHTLNSTHHTFYAHQLLN